MFKSQRPVLLCSSIWLEPTRRTPNQEATSTWLDGTDISGNIVNLPSLAETWPADAGSSAQKKPSPFAKKWNQGNSGLCSGFVIGIGALEEDPLVPSPRSTRV